MLIVAAGLLEDKTAGSVEIPQLLIFVDHEKLNFFAAVLNGFVLAERDKFLAEAEILIFGQNGKAAQIINVIFLPFQLNTASDPAVDPHRVDVSAAFFRLFQVIKCHERRTSGVIFFRKTEPVAVQLERPMDRIETHRQVFILN